MKKKLPLILLIFFILLIAVGVYGVVRARRSAKSDARLQTTSSRVSKRANGSYDSSRYLTVKLPSGLKSIMKDYEGFTVSFNPDNRTPNYVVWELLGSETEGNASRYNKFWQDEELTACPSTYDYSYSGYDRGHLCPAADQKWSDQAMVDCFSLANIAPQDHDLNTGAWKTLENKERTWAQRDSAIIIIAGPLYSDSDKERIGDAGVRVPGAFFKVLAAPFLDKPRGIAFVYPNMTAPGNMQQYSMTIRDLEKIVGFNFFSDLTQEEQDRLETTASFNEWNRR